MPPSSQQGCRQGSLQRRAQPAGRERDEGPDPSLADTGWSGRQPGRPCPPLLTAVPWAPGMAGPLGLRWGGHLGMG